MKFYTGLLMLITPFVILFIIAVVDIGFIPVLLIFCGIGVLMFWFVLAFKLLVEG